MNIRSIKQINKTIKVSFYFTHIFIYRWLLIVFIFFTRKIILLIFSFFSIIPFCFFPRCVGCRRPRRRWKGAVAATRRSHRAARGRWRPQSRWWQRESTKQQKLYRFLFRYIHFDETHWRLHLGTFDFLHQNISLNIVKK